LAKEAAGHQVQFASIRTFGGAALQPLPGFVDVAATVRRHCEADIRHRRSIVAIVRRFPIRLNLAFEIVCECDRFDLRLFVDTDDDIRLMRRIRRDIVDRGRDLRSVEDQYYKSVRPMHRLHVAPSKQHAHLVVPEGGQNAQALDVIVGRLRHLLDAV